jgi:osmotically-inducible protein OsmY
MFRLLILLLVLGLLAAWWLGYVPGTGRETLDGRVDPDAVRQRGAEVAERMTEGVNRASEALDDAALTAKIKSKMALDDLVRARTIDVDTVDAVVTLRGTVTSTQERDRALQLARETLGVRSVIDQLRLTP